MFFRRLHSRFFVTRGDYKGLLTYLKFSQNMLNRIKELIEKKDENVYQCFHQLRQKIIRGEEGLFKEILDNLYCAEIFLNKCKCVIKESSQIENKEIAEAALVVLGSLNDEQYIDKTFIYRRQKKPLLEKYIEELRMIFSFQVERIPPTLRYYGSKEELYVIIGAVSGLAAELEKLLNTLRGFISFLEEEGKRICNILKEGQELCERARVICNLIMENNQLMSKITPKYTSGKDETGWLAEKRFTNTLQYMGDYRRRLSLNLEYSREYVPSIEHKSAQEYLIKLDKEIFRIEQESRVYKRLYEAYLRDDQRIMALIIKERNPDYYVGYNLEMTAYCGVVPKPFIRGIWINATTSTPYITPEGYAQKLSKIILRDGYRPSRRESTLDRFVFGSYTLKNIFFYPKKHISYGGSIALIGFSVSEYCVLSKGSECVIMTPKNIPPKRLTLYVQDPDRLGGGLEFGEINVRGDGYMSLQDYIIGVKTELERLHTPFKIDHWTSNI